MAPTPSSANNLEAESRPQRVLTAQLNDLLQAVHIPIPILSPTDLTPSLLIAILESFLGTKISLIERQNGAGKRPSKASQIQNMKIFLGVLETDILQRDVGLSNIDPRRLAEGEWDEVVFVGELLCWVGRRIGLVKVNNSEATPCEPQGYADTPGPSRRRRVSEPYPSQPELDTDSVFYCGSSTTMTTKQTQQTLSSFFGHTDGETRTDSDTTIDNADYEEKEFVEDDNPSTPSSGAFSFLPPFSTPPGDEVHPPRCIHEVPSPSLLLSADLDGTFTPPNPRRAHVHDAPRDSHERSFCDCPPSLVKNLPIEHDHVSPVSVSIRHDGYIQPVDEDFELASFERSRVMSTSPTPQRDKTSERGRKLAAANREFSRTLQLLNERARLLSQLANIKKTKI